VEEGEEGEGERGRRTNVVLELRFAEVFDDGFDGLKGSIGLEVSSDKEFAGLVRVQYQPLRLNPSQSRVWL